MTTIKVEHNYGDPLYLKADPEQIEYTFVGVYATKGQTKLLLSALGEIFEVFDFEVSKERDQAKLLGFLTQAEEE